MEDAFPGHENIHAMHHKLFWLIKALIALGTKDKTQILHYHNLLRISGMDGYQRLLYVAQLTLWLQKELE